MQLVLPETFRKQALQGCHDDLDHCRIEWTIDLLRDQFYWPGMDYLTIEVNEDGKDVHILVITDHFMWYAQATVTSSQTAKCTAQNLWDKFIVHFGLPEEILTDQGCNFESDLLWELCELAQVKKIRTSGYHPQTNGQRKHFNATLINMLGTLPEKPKSTWREQVLMLVHAYNYTSSNATDFSPYYLMFGRKPHLPIDIPFSTNTAKLKGSTSTKYVENLRWRLELAYKTTIEVVKEEQEKKTNDTMIRKLDVQNYR